MYSKVPYNPKDSRSRVMPYTSP